MEKVRPIFIKLLLGAIAVYLIGVAAMLSDLYCMVIRLEHKVMHITGECRPK